MIIGEIMKTLKRTTNFAIVCFVTFLICFPDVAYTADIKANETYYFYSFSAFRYVKLGLNQKTHLLTPSINTSHRRKDLSKPGDYICPPEWKSASVDSTDIKFIGSLVEPYLADDYYDDRVLEIIKNYESSYYKRKEFYFDFYSDGTFMIISGLYDKFTHIIVFTEYDSKQSFIDKARHFFKLPLIDIKNVEYDEYIYPSSKTLDCFYSFADNKNRFKLFGYPVTQFREEPGYEKIDYKFSVIDLTIYAKVE